MKFKAEVLTVRYCLSDIDLVILCTAPTTSTTANAAAPTTTAAAAAAAATSIELLLTDDPQSQTKVILTEVFTDMEKVRMVQTKRC